MLFVHAHPDDETINNGATMAHYAAAGAQVTLVTCTLGEEGEILVPELAQLAADQADQLGGWRIAELGRALDQLGVPDRVFLGGAGRFRDSGMLGSPANQHPRAFWRAETDADVRRAAVTALVAVIDDIRPQVLVTYDEVGGYGHPDHVMAHRVAMAAVAAAGWRVAKVYCNAVPATAAQELLAAARDESANPFRPTLELAHIPDDQVSAVVRAPASWAAKRRALSAHATQVSVSGDWYALSNELGLPITSSEYYRLVSGTAGGPRDSDGRETDLFGGLDV
jgi:N-acetyl-1-D-myo-inositol-2-amino-2-deoxy-alpha-D-glucopyranoside deacetylase